VQEAGDEAQHAEEDVDEGVGGAEAGFDPDWCLWLVGVVGTEGDEGVPGRGGKRTARTARKKSVLHILMVGCLSCQVMFISEPCGVRRWRYSDEVEVEEE
jgi:hypothetical protein